MQQKVSYKKLDKNFFFSKWLNILKKTKPHLKVTYFCLVYASIHILTYPILGTSWFRWFIDISKPLLEVLISWIKGKQGRTKVGVRKAQRKTKRSERIRHINKMESVKRESSKWLLSCATCQWCVMCLDMRYRMYSIIETSLSIKSHARWIALWCLGRDFKLVLRPLG